MFHRALEKWIVAAALVMFVAGPSWGHVKYRYSSSHKPPRRRVFHVHKTEPVKSVDRQKEEVKQKPRPKRRYRYNYAHKPPRRRIRLRSQ